MSGILERLDLGHRDGLRVAVKDTIDIAGHRTRAGSRALEDAPIANANAEIVDRLLASGCRIIGKTVLHELAFGVTGINDWSGTPENPRFPGLVPGGSSSGSAAAVATGHADVAIGTDTGGSIRIPAACCGVWGLKPTFGRVSRRGVMPAATTLDCVGPFADSAATLMRAMEILAPDFSSERAQRSIGTARVAVLDGLAIPEINEAMHRALAGSDLGSRSASLPMMPAAFTAGLSVINAETWSAAGHLLPTGLVGEDVALRLKAASRTTAAQLAEAEEIRTHFSAEVDALLHEVDAILLPTLPVFPPSIDDGRNNRSAVALTSLVRPFNLSGHPALAMPSAATYAGPVSLQLVGRKGDDEGILAIAAHIAARL